MSAAKHTPGPWWVTDHGVRDSGGYICHTNPVQRYEGQDERYQREVSERNSDKLLIAAGPEMYEALKLLDEAYCDVSPDMDREARNRGRQALIKARAAIAKAEDGAA